MAPGVRHTNTPWHIIIHSTRPCSRRLKVPVGRTPYADSTVAILVSVEVMMQLYSHISCSAATMSASIQAGIRPVAIHNQYKHPVHPSSRLNSSLIEDQSIIAAPRQRRLLRGRPAPPSYEVALNNMRHSRQRQAYVETTAQNGAANRSHSLQRFTNGRSSGHSVHISVPPTPPLSNGGGQRRLQAAKSMEALTMNESAASPVAMRAAKPKGVQRPSLKHIGANHYNHSSTDSFEGEHSSHR